MAIMVVVTEGITKVTTRVEVEAMEEMAMKTMATVSVLANLFILTVDGCS